MNASSFTPDDPFPARLVFPLPDDRLVVDAFLAGRKIFINKTATVNTHGGVLRIDKIKVAWYDPSGALIACLPAGMNTQTSRRLIEHIAQIMGAAVTVTRERRDGASSSWFYGDQPIHINEPFTIMGPLGVLAYRASTQTSSLTT